MFLDDKKEEFVKKAGGVYKDGVSLSAKAWKELSDSAKKPYEDKAKAAKAKYEKDLKAFLDAGGEKKARNSKKDKEGGRKKKDKDAPKRPAGGAYGCFLAAKREEIKKSLPAGHAITDVTKKASELWKAASAADKKKYEAEYAKKAEAYKVAMEEYKKNGGEAADEGEDEEGKEASEEEDAEEEEEDEETSVSLKRPAAAPAAGTGKKARKAGA